MGERKDLWLSVLCVLSLFLILFVSDWIADLFGAGPDTRRGVQVCLYGVAAGLWAAKFSQAKKSKDG
jgi:hypothetical protein